MASVMYYNFDCKGLSSNSLLHAQPNTSTMIYVLAADAIPCLRLQSQVMGAYHSIVWFESADLNSRYRASTHYRRTESPVNSSVKTYLNLLTITITKRIHESASSHRGAQRTEWQSKPAARLRPGTSKCLQCVNLDILIGWIPDFL